MGEVDATFGLVVGVFEIEESVGEFFVERIASEGGVERRTADANNHHEEKERAPRRRPEAARAGERGRLMVTSPKDSSPPL